MTSCDPPEFAQGGIVPGDPAVSQADMDESCTAVFTLEDFARWRAEALAKAEADERDQRFRWVGGRLPSKREREIIEARRQSKKPGL